MFWLQAESRIWYKLRYFYIERNTIEIDLGC